MRMICDRAKECNDNEPCIHKRPHEEVATCPSELRCLGSCIPYIEPASKPLTDHAKYCRLSKQAGGLCACKDIGDKCIVNVNNLTYVTHIRPCFTTCPCPEKQQPVELPKDPLEELIDKEKGRFDKQILSTNYTRYDLERYLREFAEKVRALK